MATLTRAGAVLHTHSVWSTLLGQHHVAGGGFTLTGYHMLGGLAGIDAHADKVFVPILANAPRVEQLSEQAVQEIAEWPNATGFLIAGRGLYTWGDTIEQARRHVEIFEFMFECEGRKGQLGDAPTNA